VAIVTMLGVKQHYILVRHAVWRLRVKLIIREAAYIFGVHIDCYRSQRINLACSFKLSELWCY
jgi:hypothetical protein